MSTPTSSTTKLDWFTLGPDRICCRHRGMIATLTKAPNGMIWTWEVTRNGRAVESMSFGTMDDSAAWERGRRAAEDFLISHPS